MAMIEDSYKVKGMTCASCVQKIEQALTTTKGIGRALADLAENKVFVQYDQEQTSEEQILQTIHQAGYEVEQR